MDQAFSFARDPAQGLRRRRGSPVTNTGSFATSSLEGPRRLPSGIYHSMGPQGPQGQSTSQSSAFAGPQMLDSRIFPNNDGDCCIITRLPRPASQSPHQDIAQLQQVFNRIPHDAAQANLILPTHTVSYSADRSGAANPVIASPGHSLVTNPQTSFSPARQRAPILGHPGSADVHFQSGGLAAERSNRSRRLQPNQSGSNAISAARAPATATRRAPPPGTIVYHNPLSPNNTQHRSQDVELQRAKVTENRACTLCAHKKGCCDLRDPCGPCVERGWPCFRGHEEIWLWQTIELDLAARTKRQIIGCREKALKEAPRNSFPLTRQMLSLNPLMAYLKDSHEITIQIKLSVGALTETKETIFSGHELTMECLNQGSGNASSSTGCLRQMEQDFTSHFRYYAFQNPWHILPRGERQKDRALIQLVGDMASLVAVFKSLLIAKVYVISGHIMFARSTMFSVLTFLAKRLAQLAEQLSKDLVWNRLRKGEARFAETRYSIGLYYRILSELKSVESDTIVSAILDDLQPELNRALVKVEVLFDLTQHIIRAQRRHILNNSEVEICPDGEKPSKSVREMKLNEYLDSIVPYIPLIETLHIAIAPGHGVVSSNTFGRDPISMATLFDRRGVQSLISRSDLTKTLQSGPRKRKSADDSPSRQPSLRDEIPTQPPGPPNYPLKDGPSHATESLPGPRNFAFGLSKVPSNVSQQTTLVNTSSSAPTVFDEPSRLTEEPKSFEPRGEHNEPLDPALLKLYTRIDRFTSGKRSPSSSLSSATICSARSLSQWTTRKSKRRPKRQFVNNHSQEQLVIRSR